MTHIDPSRRQTRGPRQVWQGSETQCRVIGLGWVICQQLIELMAGRFGVDSTFGKGSTFWFELPLRATA